MRSGTLTSASNVARCHRSPIPQVLALLLMLPGVAFSQTNYTWNGSVSSAWNNAANWTPNSGFPLAADNVTLVTGTNPLVMDIDRSVNNLTVTSGNHDLGLHTLTYTGMGGFSGGSLSNGALVVNSTGLTTCSGTTFSVPFSGTTGRILFNGSLFNNAVTLSKTNGANDYSAGGNTFQADLNLNVSAGRIYLFHTDNDTYNGNIILSSSGGGNGVFTGQNSGTAVLAAGREISIGGSGFSSGQLRLRGLKQVGPTPQILTLTGATDLHLEAGTQFNGPVTFSAPGLFISGTVFQQNAVLTKTGGGNDYSAGGNLFNGSVDLANSGTGILFLNNTGTDAFNGDLSFANTNTGSIRFGNGGGASILAAGRVLSIGVPGFSSGSLHLRNFIQLGGTPQSLTLTGNADFLIGGSAVVTGALSIQAPSVYVSGGTYDGYCSFTKTGPGNDHSTGGNTFNNVVELNNTGTGNLFLNDSGVDQFNADLLFSNTGTGGIRFGNNSGTAVLANGAFLGIGPAGFSSGMLSLKDFIQLGTSPQSLTLTGSADLVIRSGSVFHGPLQATAPGITLSGGTFHSACSFTKSGNGNDYSAGGNIFHGPVEFGITGTGAMFLHDSGFDRFFGDVTVVGSGSGSIRFGNNSGSSELVAGRTISVGTAGFTSGGLYLNSFVQLGATSQQLLLTGTARLQFGSATVFDGALTAEAPSLYLNGSTFNAAANFTKTGTTDDVNTGGNVFNGTTEITNTGSGILYLNYSGFDQFNGDLLLNCTSTRGIRFGIASGSSQLAAGRTISVGGLGYTNGLLMLHSFTQLGSTPQSLILTGTSDLRFGPGTTFNGDVVAASPEIYFNGTTFNGTLHATKTGPTDDASTGGNVFNGFTTFNNISTGRMYLHNTGVDQFNSDIVLNNTGTAGILFGYSSGSGTLAAGRTVTIGGSGFTDGILWFKSFTQVGPTAQNLALSGTADLYFAQGSTFDGAITASSPGLYFNGTTFNSTVTATKTGPVNNSSTGGNIFNGITTLSNTGAGRLYINNTGVDAFNADLILSNTGNGGILFGYSSGASTLAAGRTVTIGGSGFTDGVLWFKSFTQVGPTAQNLPLSGTADLYFAQGSTFDGAVIASAPGLYFNGTTFNSTVTATKTGPVNNSSTGGNIFNGITTLSNTGAGRLYINNTGVDAFNADLILSNTGNGGILFGYSSGASTLAAGRTVTIGGSGFTDGILWFERFTQVGNTAQNLPLTGTADLYFAQNSTFNGAVTASSPGLYFNGTTFNSTVNATKTGPVNNSSTGGNTFNGATTLTNTGPGILYIHNTGIDAFNGDLIVNSTNSGGIRFGNGSGSGTLAAGRTVSVGVLGFTDGMLSFRSFTQVGPTPQTLTLTGTAYLNFDAGSSFDGDMLSSSPSLRFGGVTFYGTVNCTKTGPLNNSGNGVNTFNGTARLTNTGSGILYMGYQGITYFNGDLLLSSTNSGGIYFGTNGGITQLAAPRVLGIGASGFTAGPLQLRNFSQLGTVPHGLVLSGTASIHFLPGTTFNADLALITPSVFLNGSTFNGVTHITKNGPVTNNCAGGNTFNGDLLVQNTSGGNLTLGGSNVDVFNGNVHFIRNGAGSMLAHNNHNTAFPKNISTVGSTNTVQFGGTVGRTLFTGTSIQQFSTDAAWPPDVRRMTLALTGGATLDLLGSVNVISDVAFTSGVVRPQAATSTSNGLLILQNGITFSDPADNNSHVDGYVRKVGNVAFTFPVGNAGILAPISMTAPTGTTSHFTAKYLHADTDPPYDHTAKDIVLDHVSRCEYWFLDRTNSTSNVVVTLSFENGRSCGVTNLNDLAVARWDGTQWRNHGNGGVAGTVTSGTVASAGTISAFLPSTAFTLASFSLANPLPIELVSFTAEPVGNVVHTQWVTATELNNERFEVERSIDAVAFELVGTLAGAGTSLSELQYALVDHAPLPGLSYYRLKQVDYDGTTTYGPVVPVQFRNTAPVELSAYPNPTLDDITLSVSGSVDGSLDISVWNAHGQRISMLSRSGIDATRSVPLSLEGLPAGMYIVRVSDNGTWVGEERVLKQ